MKKIYFTLTGTNHYYGKDFINPDMKLTLVKEPDNAFDKEAIKVVHEALGTIGYVANSPYTMVGEKSYSAGRLYDKIGDTVECTVLFKLAQGILCFVEVEE
ncbi:MAG: HIRAN domain-containing protein [Bacillota bacterium]|nr:HIRAN domain-containing protein [Bacillota bacterium]